MKLLTYLAAFNVGVEIIRGMKQKGGEYTEGHLLDPEDRKIYRCKLRLEGAQLMVRGSIEPKHGGNRPDYMYSNGKISKLRSAYGLLSH